MNAVTNVGAPSYTSGLQKWKGTAATLNAKSGDGEEQAEQEEHVACADRSQADQGLDGCEVEGCGGP
jgi:hypothetical protein